MIGSPADESRLQRLVGLDVASWLDPWPAALDAVQRAAGRGLRPALFSNAPLEVADAIDRLPWMAGFWPRLFSCRLGMIKPEPAAYRAVLTRLDAAAHEVHFVDDRPGNVEAAMAAGLHATLFCSPTQIDAIA